MWRGAADAGPGGEAGVRSSSSVLYFAVPDIQAAYGKLKEDGVHFEHEPDLIARMPEHELWMTFFRDTEGNLLALMSEVAR
ncbi:MAG: VOC family protein [Candidatus Sulfotelmatobacter sp.]